MPSFDIVSEVKLDEVRNATENTKRELATRFDFRGVDAIIDYQNGVVSLRAEAEFQCLQMLDMLRNNLVKRKIDPLSIDDESEVVHSGKTYTKEVRFKQGVEQPVAKKLVKLIKDSKLKVQAAIQGDQVRVTGKKRDDLQQVIALVREADLGQPFQFENYRD